MGSRRIRLIAASVGFLVLLGITLAVTTQPDDADPESVTKARAQLPLLDPEEVDQLEIRSPDGETVQLRKGEAGWRLVEPLDADANDNYVELALRKLGELPELHRGVAATRPDNHERLEVADTNGVEVIARRDDEALAHIFVGASKAGATMVRVAAEDTVHSLRGALKSTFQRKVPDWRERKIVDETAAEVREVSFTSAQGSFHFVRGEDDTWEQGEGDSPIEEFDPATVQSVVSTLSRMRAAAFAEPSMSLADAGIGPDSSTAKLVTEDDEIVLRLGRSLDDDAQYHLVREGREAVYIISKFIAERIEPGAERFKKGAPITKQAPGIEGEVPEGITKEQLDELMQNLQKTPIKVGKGGQKAPIRVGGGGQP